MNYSTIKEICRMNKISIRTVSDEVGITMDGLKRGIDSGGLGIKYIIPLCKSLCITPNKLFGVEEPVRSINQTQTGGVGNTQISESGDLLLQNQLAEKDAQISRLLGILEKLNK